MGGVARRRPDNAQLMNKPPHTHTHNAIQCMDFEKYCPVYQDHSYIVSHGASLTLCIIDAFTCRLGKSHTKCSTFASVVNRIQISVEQKQIYRNDALVEHGARDHIIYEYLQMLLVTIAMALQNCVLMSFLLYLEMKPHEHVVFKS